jgi:hypothetical protein
VDVAENARECDGDVQEHIHLVHTKREREREREERKKKERETKNENCEKELLKNKE